MRPTAAMPALALAALAFAAPAAAQDTVTVVPGAGYDASGLQRTLLGTGYRAAWTTPIRVPVLDPDRHAGGLTVIQRGGGLSTESLRMQGADGRQYVFRSVDKNARRGLPEDLHGTLVAEIVQGTVPSKHPAAALVVAPLAEALGLLHATPSLYVMPDHPFLGEHRADFAGMLGQVEERPEEAGDEGGPGFHGAERVSGTEAMLERLEDTPRERLAVGEYLRARLLDMVVGDWDRHYDQWRWARFEEADGALWRPVPRDRDNAFSRHEGVLLGAARSVQPQLTRFTARYEDVPGLVRHASDLDRRLLSAVEWPAWEAEVRTVQARLTDTVIAAALRRLPPEHHALHGAWLEEALRARRDALPAAAREFYRMLATEVDLHATDRDEEAVVERHPDGTVEVTVRLPGAEPHLRRRFHPAETREVRLWLQGGDDRATVRGNGPGAILVRVLGGGGDDALADSTRAPRRTVLYDHRGDNRIDRGAGARVDTREWREPPREALFGNPPAPRDWGSEMALLSPVAEWRTLTGPLVGAGPAWTRYGFRRRPHAERVSAALVWAPFRGAWGVEAEAERVRTGSDGGTRAHLYATGYDVVRHAGGHVELTRVGGGARLYRRLGGGATLTAGPEVRWTDPGPIGAAYAQAGAEAHLELEGRDAPTNPRRGAWGELHGRVFAAEAGPFGGVDAEARGYLTAADAGPTLAFRGGAKVALGSFPFPDAAFLGGRGTLRGYPEQRFASEVALYGGAELRQRLGRVHLGVARARLGVIAFADAGVAIGADDDWARARAGVGGGLWIEALGRVATAAVAHGEGWHLHLTLGPQF